MYWRDGVCSSDKEKQRKIVYIPQTYLNRLSDEEEETTEIDTIIQDIVLQNEKCSDAYNLMLKRISEKKQAVAKTIVDFLKIVSDRNNICEKCKVIGDKDSIESEIRKLNSQLELLSSTYDVTDEDIKEYQESIEEVKNLKSRFAAISKDVLHIKEISSIIEVKSFSYDEVVIYSKDIAHAAEEVKKIADEAWLTKQAAVLQLADNEQKEIENSIKKFEETVKKLQPKIEGNERIINLSAAIVKAKARLAKFSEYQNQLQQIQAQYLSSLEKLGEVFAEFSQIYCDYVDNINREFVSSTDDLEFYVKKVLRIEQFSRKILEIIDNRSINRFTEFKIQDITEEQLSPKNIKAFIESILNNSKESLQLKGGYSLESALREILTDWYNIDYIVRMNNDNIQDMSPGKKALVLLRLLISLAESTCPILIDQPEDDLDNRSIFDELIHFIKEKKVHRQIITVTHNANIVLGGDAELVIVANQCGKNTPN